ncbi:GTPase-activating protein GYP8 [Sporobolomyces koalae]|uniref:GTPase-activating protein GYP8 n=1 Tax=Sporobolomyces koalae TaxID=500713 RepID=UPI003182AABB
MAHTASLHAAEPAGLGTTTAATLNTAGSGAADPCRPSSGSEPTAKARATREEDLAKLAAEQDLDTLRRMADESGGFETDELRRLIWPLLLGCRSSAEQPAMDELAPREDERQVKLDIARSFINYPCDVTDPERDALRVRLERAILTVLRKHPALQYFQGYHDIVSILLLTLDDDNLLAQTTEQMSLHRIRDSMGPGLEPTLGYLKLAHRLIQRVDPQMYSLVNQAAAMPFFALSWALTLFSHDLYEVAVIARLFDFLLAHNPAMISYLVVAILLTKKIDLVECLAQEDNDPAMVHSVLSQLPNIVLSTGPSGPVPASVDPASSTPDEHERCHEQTGNESEALFSSSSASASSVSLDLASSVASSETLDESVISLSEASSPWTSGSTLRRRHVNRQDRLSFSSFDSDLHAFDDSMLSDPDMEHPAISSFDPPPRPASLLGSDRDSCGATSPKSAREFDSHHDEGARKPPRTILVQDLIESALDLSRRYPLVSEPNANATPMSSIAVLDSSVSTHVDQADDNIAAQLTLAADTILGPNSCVFTYSRSLTGDLTDVQAEMICRDGIDIVHLEALLPDAPEHALDDDDDDDDEACEAEEEEEFELVGTAPSDPKSKRRRRRSSRVPPSAFNGAGKINLGPHGWLVVGGVAVATAVAYGVYGGRTGGGPAGVGSVGFGLGTGGLGLRTGTGTTAVAMAPVGSLSGTGVAATSSKEEGGGEGLKGWVKGTLEL